MSRLAVGLLCWAALNGGAALAAGDCERPGASAMDAECLDASWLPPAMSNGLTEAIAAGRRFYRLDTPVFLVSAQKAAAVLPYFLRAQPPRVARGQIHVPEAYFASRQAQGAAARTVWIYIIGHEMAHAHQAASGVLDAMTAPVDSVTLAELHADFLAGFFLASQFGLSLEAVDHVFGELKALPVGRPGERGFHGTRLQRFTATTQGALLAARRPEWTATQASAEGIGCVFDLMSLGGAVDGVCKH